jgi:hypothetical protein
MKVTKEAGNGRMLRGRGKEGKRKKEDRAG